MSEKESEKDMREKESEKDMRERERDSKRASEVERESL
jgi:hypothetical protein